MNVLKTFIMQNNYFEHYMYVTDDVRMHSTVVPVRK